jgi:hypothetical protein
VTSRIGSFAVKLAIGGIPEHHGPDEMEALQNELCLRPHLMHPQVSWDARNRQLVVWARTTGLGAQSTADQMAEELLEVAAGLLSSDEEVSVAILSVAPA